MARQRGFDGYLLNFECQLKGRLNQSRALTTWVSLLTNALKRIVGEHAECVWYDSVIIDGSLKWQNRLNSLNLPFFFPSSSFFANYFWPPHYPLLTAQYFLSIESHHTASKGLNDIYFGVDVWGRGSHGGGGFGSYKAISHVDPEFLGLSVALFGQAWSWETEQDKPDFNWDAWWAYDRTLWLGPENEGDLVQITVPPIDPATETEECAHGLFTPIASFFARKAPPNPAQLPFFTSFCPGVGFAWFVSGNKVFQTEQGWTDVDKGNSLGDLVWPKPSVTGDIESPDLKATSSLCMDDAWLGGSSLRISLTLPATVSVANTFWLPIQSLSITPHKAYKISVVLKSSHQAIDFATEFAIREVAEGLESPINATKLPVEDMSRGWFKHSFIFSIASEEPSDLLCSVGITARYQSSSPCDASVTLGALSAHLVPNATSTLQPHVSQVDFERSPTNTEPSSPFSGVLTWDISARLTPLSNISLESIEDPRPAWTMDHSYPSYIYFNIYIQTLDSAERQDAVFIGTTGFDGAATRFHIDTSHHALAAKPDTEGVLNSVRFYVQGITDRGDALPWNLCRFIDVQW